MFFFAFWWLLSSRLNFTILLTARRYGFGSGNRRRTGGRRRCSGISCITDSGKRDRCFADGSVGRLYGIMYFRKVGPERLARFAYIGSEVSLGRDIKSVGFTALSRNRLPGSRDSRLGSRNCGSNGSDIFTVFSRPISPLQYPL